MADVVLDSSAILAVLNEEPGADFVIAFLPGAHASALILAEVATKLVVRGGSVEDARRAIEPLGLILHPFSADRAYATAQLCTERAALSLSLADRACLALAKELGMPAVTGDRPWTQVPLGLDIRLIR